MRRLAFLAAAACFSGNATAATVLHCGKLIDVRALQVREQATIVVDGNRITRVVQGFAAAAPQDRVVDLRTQTCMPGLMDMHVHLDGETSAQSTTRALSIECGRPGLPKRRVCGTHADGGLHHGPRSRRRLQREPRASPRHQSRARQRPTDVHRGPQHRHHRRSRRPDQRHAHRSVAGRRPRRTA